MKKTVKGIIVSVLVNAICFSIVGCSVESSETVNTDLDLEQTEWENQKLDEMLIADFEVEGETEGAAFEYMCERTAISLEGIKNAFFYSDTSEMEYSKRYESPNEPRFGYVYFGTSQEGLSITSNYSGSRGSTNEAEMYRHFLGYDPDGWGTDGKPEQLGTSEDLSFLDKNAIEMEIKEGLNKLIPYVEIEKVNFYTLSADYLNEIQSITLEDIKKYNDPSWYAKEKEYEREWKYEEGAYYVTVEMSMDGIAIKEYLNDMLADETRLGGYKATFIYNKNGCVYADLPMLLEVKQSQEESIISVSQALDELKKDITSVILTNENVIEDAKLQYVLVYVSSSTELEILPMWVFEGKVLIETNKGDLGVVEVYESYFVNAITGEVLH